MTIARRDPGGMNGHLHQILRRGGVEEWTYSLDGYRDDCQCMERDGAGWKVYFGERGKQKKCVTFESQKEAGAELLRRLVRDEAKREKMQREFDAPVYEFEVIPKETVGQEWTPYAAAVITKESGIKAAKKEVLRAGGVPSRNRAAKKSYIARIKGINRDLDKMAAEAAYKAAVKAVEQATVKGIFSKKSASAEKSHIPKNAKQQKLQG